jgi:hypothetical protein
VSRFSSDFPFGRGDKKPLSVPVYPQFIRKKVNGGLDPFFFNLHYDSLSESQIMQKRKPDTIFYHQYIIPIIESKHAITLNQILTMNNPGDCTLSRQGKNTNQ